MVRDCGALRSTRGPYLGRVCPLMRRRRCGTRRRRGILLAGPRRFFARYRDPRARRAETMHSPVMATVSGSEYRSQDDQPCQRERPEAEVPPKLLESAFRTVRQIENEIASDSQRCRRNQRYEVNHSRPLSSGLYAAPRNCGWQRS
jgi:hypothetical protein